MLVFVVVSVVGDWYWWCWCFVFLYSLLHVLTVVSFRSNVRAMSKSHSFFIPDIEYLHDVEGLLLFLVEKVFFVHSPLMYIYLMFQCTLFT